MNATQSEKTKQVRSHLLAMPLILDGLPPWIEIDWLSVSADGRHRLYVSLDSFKRLFAGQRVKRDRIQLRAESHGVECIAWHGLRESFPTTYDVPPLADEDAIISDAEARDALAEQTVCAGEAVV